MRGSRGFTLIELLLVVAILGVLLSMAMVGYGAARVRGGEASAVGTLGSINQAQFAYMQTCGNQRYAPTLVSLGDPVPGSGVAFLSPDLAQSDPLLKSGYQFGMSGTEIDDAPPGCTGARPLSDYRVVADPLNPGVTGRLHFGTNADRVIFSDTVSFGPDLPESGDPPHGAEIR